MRTIKDNLEHSIKLLQNNKVVDHIKACELIYMDISTIKGFDKDPINVLVFYQKYLVDKHQSIKKVGIFAKIIGYFKALMTRHKVVYFLNRCQAKSFGDGDKYLQEVFSLIRKAI